jgi:UDP-glucose 4-epimerase
MKALVTGGAGFIGSHLVDALLARGDRVVILDDLSSGKRENLSGALTAGAELIEGDITDAAVVEDVFERHFPEAVFHLAAQMDVRVSVARPLFDLNVNVAGTINLARAAVARRRPRFVFASTGGAIYGEGDGRELPLSEDAECWPDAPYGLSKLAAETYLDLFSRQHGLPATSLRLGNVYGPRQDPHGEAGVVALFCGALLDPDGRPRVFGDGLQTRDYIYVDDVVAALLAAAEADAASPLNIGTGRETNVLDLGRLLARAYGMSFEPQMEPPREGEVQRIAIDPARAATELAWRATTELEQGLPVTAEAIRDDREQARPPRAAVE